MNLEYVVATHDQGNLKYYPFRVFCHTMGVGGAEREYFKPWWFKALNYPDRELRQRVQTLFVQIS